MQRMDYDPGRWLRGMNYLLLFGSRNLQCNAEGKCQCKPGVTGDKCDACAPNHYDFTSQGCKPCGCSESGSYGNIPQCDPVTGVCICKKNVEAQQSLARLQTAFGDEAPCKTTICKSLVEFKCPCVSPSDEFAMNNKNIDAVRLMIETDRHVYRGEPKPTKVARERSAPKRMIAPFLNKTGHVTTIGLENCYTVNSDWYTTICLPEVIDELRKNNLHPTYNRTTHDRQYTSSHRDDCLPGRLQAVREGNAAAEIFQVLSLDAPSVGRRGAKTIKTL
ncbi:Laminin subunit gamma-1 [Eumeta japonica]|uniref:Laminin subunit gamma-1 n=1 Tax=Eumeta variegata TaxID=151549 RepID=A0A4C1SIB9_EUMVA|nr:Laminin subunit gamma-1 [Eumeta japonica]